MSWLDDIGNFIRQDDPISAAIRQFFLSFFGALGRFFDSLFQAELDIKQNVEKLHRNFDELRTNIPKQVQRVKDFKFDPKWKSRVINVPIAIEQVKKLFEDVTQGWRERLDLLREPLHEFVLIFKAEQASAGDQNQAVAGVTKAAVKLDEIATLIQQLADASDELIKVDHIFDEVLDFFEKLDQIFLQQKNLRRVEQLTDGGSIRVRIGKLHS